MLKWVDILKFARLGNPPPDKRVEKTDSEWKQELDPEVFRITRLKGTERPHSSEMCSRFDPGIYMCACCGTPLFDATEKFDSSSGWPSFTQPIADNAIAYQVDNSFGMKRVETLCNTCDAHLGHVFPDGPSPSGLRYCMNAVALEKQEATHRSIIVGGGCFWCTEALFQEVYGVVSVESGYSGGDISNPTYREVCSGRTGHAEVIKITYDPGVISLDNILRIHLSTHDPTTLNQQGADRGTQYRSIILPSSDEEMSVANKVVEEMQEYFDDPIITEVKRYEAFYPAEEDHQNYYRSNPDKPYCQVVIDPKIQKLRKALLAK